MLWCGMVCCGMAWYGMAIWYSRMVCYGTGMVNTAADTGWYSIAHPDPVSTRHVTPFAVHLRKIYIHLRQQLKLYGKYTFISTSMNFMNANELSITLFACVLTFNSING